MSLRRVPIMRQEFMEKTSKDFLVGDTGLPMDTTNTPVDQSQQDDSERRVAVRFSRSLSTPTSTGKSPFEIRKQMSQAIPTTQLLPPTIPVNFHSGMRINICIGYLCARLKLAHELNILTCVDLSTVRFCCS